MTDESTFCPPRSPDAGSSRVRPAWPPARRWRRTCRPASAKPSPAAWANPSQFDLSQVKHVVLLMQENRSFDHYFGTLPGVRGFGDRHAMRLANGRSVFQQPDPANPDGYLLPYHLDTSKSAPRPSPHSATPGRSSTTRGPTAPWTAGCARTSRRTATQRSVHHGVLRGADIPFQYALANAFTICDNYFCSVLGPTHPNRYMWMTGTVDPTAVRRSRPRQQRAERHVLLDHVRRAAPGRRRLVEVLPAGGQLRHERARVLRPVHRRLTVIEPVPERVRRQHALQRAPASDPTMAFEEDCANGTLPTVSWLFPTSVASEHPSYLPAAGAQFVASKIEALAANEDLWNSTVFILNYDENDGFFDHVPPITPPKGTADEFTSLKSPGGTPGGGLDHRIGFPGAGDRHLAVDRRRQRLLRPARPHVVLRFLERVTGVTEPNISDWRRATFSDFPPRSIIARAGAIDPRRHGLGHRSRAGLPEAAIDPAPAGLPRGDPDPTAVAGRAAAALRTERPLPVRSRSASR